MKTLSVSVPGSVMLMGEHAVLYQKSAIIGATLQRVNICLIFIKAYSMHSVSVMKNWNV